METSRDDFSIALRSAFLKKGNKQKFSLFALIITSILFVTLESIQSKYLDYLRFAIKDGIYRASVIASVPEQYSKNLSDVLEKHFNTYKEN